MKMSLRNLLIALGVLLLAFVAIQFTKRDGKSKTLKSDLVSIDTATVSRIEITSAKGMIILDKENENWMTSSGDNEKKAKESTVKSMLATLNTIKPDRLVARKEAKWKNYQVDSSGTRVKVLNGDKVLADIVLGRFGVAGQRSFHTFVRLFDEENVYAANDFMKMSILEEAKDYRDNTVLTLDDDSLTSIQFNYPDSAFLLVKNAKWVIDDDEVDSASLTSYFQSIRNMTNKNFYDSDITIESTHEVVFSFADRPAISIEGFEVEEGMAIRSSENQNELFLDPSLAEEIFKGKSVFATTKN